ncbi:MAG: PAS domain S-box protein [Desulfobulbaceae bacterium]|uniref:histidine kinase n=1 Tax=Candidatus Desulfobia pelagia TaxID=2841692 RepID=A0A8J6TFF8_9BACT|nr:PAS domain S-box protein [Candidatus Desulfobia pelagia]
MTTHEAPGDNFLSQQIISHFDLIFRAIPDAVILTDKERCIVKVNSAFTDLFEYSFEEVKGKHTKFFYISEEAYEEQGRIRFNLSAEEKLKPFEVPYRKKNGEVFQSETVGTIINDEEGRFLGFLGIIRDISKRKELEKDIKDALSSLELQVKERTRSLQETNNKLTTESIERQKTEENLCKEKNKLEAVLAALGDGVTLQDKDFRIIYQNEIHKQKQGDHTGEYCYKAYQGKDSICEGCLLEQCYADGEIHRRETKAETSNGTIYIEVSASPIKDSSGSIIGGIETVRDITQRKRLEQQLQQNMKMEAIGTLAGGIAHDFNNILSAIIGYSELAKLVLPSENKAVAHIDQVIQSGKRASDLVNQILTFSRKDDQDLQAITPHLLIKETLKMLRSSIPASINIKQNIDPQSGHILADPTKIHQICMNLCTNALHSMEDQKGTLTVELHRRDVETHDNASAPSGPFIVLSVSDTGHGMDKATIERVFEPYFTKKKFGKGTGLGLSVIDGIVKGLNGFINVESEPGKGSSFHVHIPALETPNPISEEKLKKKLPINNGDAHILVVDDEATIVDMLEAVLLALGYSVTKTTRSREALQEIEKYPDKFDLLITDQTMPDISGVELAQNVLKIKPAMPIILCTGYSSMISPEKACGIGIKYIQKPFKAEELAAIVRTALDEKE